MGDELAYSKMYWRHERAQRLYSIKCSMANAFFIGPGGLACKLKTQLAQSSRDTVKGGGEETEGVLEALIFFQLKISS